MKQHLAVAPGMLVGSGRFHVQSALGEGATGRVYRAQDLLLQREVALKALKITGPDEEYRLKKEFRSIVGVTHPNLVRLYDLVVGEQVFFTMEMLRGTDFLHWVWGQATPPQWTEGDGWLERLRGAFTQLALGIGALHAAGMLHRDIKPSNVFVTLEGRVVLLDVGLASSIASWESQRSRVGTFVGTVPYMAPEQGRGRELNEGADWYSAGVLLYEALSGHLPYESPGAQVTLTRSALQARMRPLPAEVPPDLRQLVRDLLSPVPEARPDCLQVLRLLGLRAAPFHPSFRAVGARHFGREALFTELEAALLATRTGPTRTVHIKGASGLGKTALVESFLWRTAHQGSTVVLRSRCHPREHVSYNAIDGLVDDLTRAPVDLPDPLSELDDAAALLQVFPMFRRIPSYAGVPTSGQPANDFKIRHRGFLALRALLRWLAARHPVVLHIDDLHWVDRDSIALLALLEQADRAPGYLILYAYRPEREAASLLGALGSGLFEQSERTELELAGLSDDAMRELVADSVPDAAPGALANIVAEAQGVPLIAAELCFAVAEQVAAAERVATAERELQQGAGAPACSYDRLVLERVNRLPDTAQRLLEMVCAAGHPIEQQLLQRAIPAPPEVTQAALLQLQYQGLARELPVRAALCIDVEHDRIRAAILSRMDVSARAHIHRRLADVLSALRGADAHQLVHHLVECGESERARDHALRAALESTERGAFHQAAELYERAIALKATSDEWQLRGAMARALVDAGLPEQAALQFAQAADLLHAREPENLEVVRLRAQAAQQLMFLGHLQPGLLRMRQAVDAVDRPYAESAAGSVTRALLLSPAAYLAKRASNKRRSTGRGLRASVDPRSDVRLDVVWAAGVSLGWAAPMQALEYQVRHAHLAYELDHPAHIARALSVSAVVLGMRGGGRAWERAMTEQAQARQLATRSKDVGAEAFVCVYSGLIAYFMGQWRDAVREAEFGLAQCQQAGRGLTWEMNMARWTSLTCRMYLGEVLEVRARMPDLIVAAQSRNDVAALATLRQGWLGLPWLCSNNPEEAQRQMDRAFAPFQGFPYGSLHTHRTLAQAQLFLYEGKARQAWDELCAAWPRLKRSFQLRMAVMHLELHDLRGRCAASLALQLAEGAERRELVRETLRCASALQKNPIAAARPMSMVLSATVDAIAGRSPAALEAIERAALGFESLGMLMHAAACRFTLRRAAPPSALSSLTLGSDGWFREQQIDNPHAWVQVLVPRCLATEQAGAATEARRQPSSKGRSPAPPLSLRRERRSDESAG